MIPLTFLCDEYIDRPKLTEQKNPFEYIVPPPPPPPPTSGVGTNIATIISEVRALVTLKIFTRIAVKSAFSALY